jgi:hypothetical protein
VGVRASPTALNLRRIPQTNNADGSVAQHENGVNPAAKDLDDIDANVPSYAQGDGGNNPIIVHPPHSQETRE